MGRPDSRSGKLRNRNVKDKGKVHPRTGHEDPKGEWRFDMI
jgi:hypothetical protein